MKQNRIKITGLSIVLLFLVAAICTLPACIAVSETELEISSINGGLGKVTADIKNIGNVTAENFTIIISVQGGLFNNINIIQECSGCGDCNTTIDPGEIKIECTKEAGFILGLGFVTVNVSAEADNAVLVTKTANGLVLGPLVIII
jgi:hypothetical protein